MLISLWFSFVSLQNYSNLHAQKSTKGSLPLTHVTPILKTVNISTYALTANSLDETDVSLAKLLMMCLNAVIGREKFQNGNPFVLYVMHGLFSFVSINFVELLSEFDCFCVAPIGTKTVWPTNNLTNWKTRQPQKNQEPRKSHCDASTIQNCTNVTVTVRRRKKKEH